MTGTPLGGVLTPLHLVKGYETFSEDLDPPPKQCMVTLFKKWFRSTEPGLPRGYTPLRLKDVLPLCTFLVHIISAPGFIPDVRVCAKRIRSLWVRNGANYTALYLKEVNRIIMKTVAAESFSKDSPVRVGTNSKGVPLIFPPSLRRAIARRSVVGIRLSLTIASLYRIIPAKPNLKLSTIVDEFQGLSRTLSGTDKLIGELFDARLTWKGYRRVMSGKAGPNYSKATLSLCYDAVAMLHHPKVLWAFLNIAFRNGSKDFIKFFLKVALGLYFPIKLLQLLSLRKPLVLGRLFQKLEGAGKVRVFAATDWWSQCLLLPLHDSIFDLLRTIPQDGTFDQTKPVKDLLNRKRRGDLIYSFDLSSATDRLPIDFQVEVLSTFLDSKVLAKYWASLLVSRPWYFGSKPLYYAIGQPMGAYSSWAMLALSHHVMVQWSARSVGWKGWFPDYAILGDDIVIADDRVAGAYLKACNILGVEVNLSKSLVSSNGVCEFAKKLISSDVEYTPVGTGVLIAVWRDLAILPALMVDLRNKSYSIYPERVVEALFAHPRLSRGRAYRLRQRALMAVWSLYGDVAGIGALLTQNTGCGVAFDPARFPLLAASYVKSAIDLMTATARSNWIRPFRALRDFEDKWETMLLGSKWNRGVMASPIFECRCKAQKTHRGITPRVIGFRNGKPKYAEVDPSHSHEWRKAGWEQIPNPHTRVTLALDALISWLSTYVFRWTAFLIYYPSLKERNIRNQIEAPRIFTFDGYKKSSYLTAKIENPESPSLADMATAANWVHTVPGFEGANWLSIDWESRKALRKVTEKAFLVYEEASKVYFATPKSLVVYGFFPILLGDGQHVPDWEQDLHTKIEPNKSTYGSANASEALFSGRVALM